MTAGPTSLRGNETALVLIEFQNEWIDAAGKLNALMADRPQFDAAIEGGKRLLGIARTERLPTLHAGLSFSPGHPELGIADLGLRGAIPLRGTFVGAAANFAPGFEPYAGEQVVSGRLGASAFAGSNLDELLRFRGIRTVLIAGFALHVCIESTLRHAHDLGYRCLIVCDATAAFTQEQRCHVLDEVVHHFGAVVTVDEVGALLARSPYTEQ